MSYSPSPPDEFRPPPGIKPVNIKPDRFYPVGATSSSSNWTLELARVLGIAEGFAWALLVMITIMALTR